MSEARSELSRSLCWIFFVWKDAECHYVSLQDRTVVHVLQSSVWSWQLCIGGIFGRNENVLHVMLGWVEAREREREKQPAKPEFKCRKLIKLDHSMSDNE